MKSNKRMKVLLREYDISIFDKNRNLSSDLDRLIGHGFEELEDCIFLRDLKTKSQHIQLADFQDKTGFESFINKIHIRDYIDGSITSRKELLEQSIEFANKLQENLLYCFAQYKFAIVVSVNDDNYLVTFHRLREGEFWLSRNLDGYNDEQGF